MFSKNILVESALVGTIHFYAYVFNNPQGLIGFGIFPNNGPHPIVYFLNKKSNRISLHFDEEMIIQMCEKSTFTTTERRLLFKKFLDFVIRLEEKAADIVFKGAKMTYLSNSREIVKYKRIYIHCKKGLSRQASSQEVES